MPRIDCLSFIKTNNANISIVFNLLYVYNPYHCKFSLGGDEFFQQSLLAFICLLDNSYTFFAFICLLPQSEMSIGIHCYLSLMNTSLQVAVL